MLTTTSAVSVVMKAWIPAMAMLFAPLSAPSGLNAGSRAFQIIIQRISVE